MGRLTPDEARALLGAYALGAVDDDERDEVGDLVLSDAEARAELHTLQLGVAWLDHASTGAPRHVWRAIADEIAADRLDPADDEAPIEDAASTAPVVDLGARRRVRPRLLAIAAAIVLVVAVGLGALLARTGDTPPTVAALAAEARAEAGTEVAPMRTPAGDRVGSLVVGADGRAYVVWSDGLAAVDADRTYQLWALAPDGPRSLGLLGSDPADRSVRLGGDVTGVAVTVEPRGGSGAPTGDPVALASRA